MCVRARACVLLQSENDEYQTITVAGSGHFGYRNLISDLLIFCIIDNSCNRFLP